jgi:hypothetical protein
MRRRALQVLFAMLGWMLGTRIFRLLPFRSSVKRTVFALTPQTVDGYGSAPGWDSLDSGMRGTGSQFDDELRLQPVSVMTYVYLLPTHHNEDGVFVRLLVENTSELATQE